LEHLQIDQIQSNLQIDKLTNLKLVTLEGDKGDPLMHPDIEKIIDIFSQAPSCPEIRVVTNGSIRSPAWWRSLAEKNYPRLTVTFSIDGLEDTNHLYRVGLNFNKIIDNATSFINAGGNAVWKFILFRHNEHQVDDIIQLSQKLGFSELDIGSCRTGDFQNLTDWPVIVNHEVSHFLQQPSNRINKKIFFNNAKKTQIAENATSNKSERICPWTSAGKLYITYLNELIPCCMMHFDTKNNYFGKTRLIEMTGGIDNQDLTKHSISTILNNKLFKHELTNSLTTGKWHFNCVRNCKSQILNNLRIHVQPKI
jgi:MoaA/NifB/PqqE/SkfB family radical SAM enzyme